MLRGWHFHNQVTKGCDFYLAIQFYSLLSLHALMKQAALLERPLWQSTEDGLWPTARKELRPSIQQTVMD